MMLLPVPAGAVPLRSGGERPAKSEWQERVVSGGCHARVVLVVVLAVLLPSLLPLLLLLGGSL